MLVLSQIIFGVTDLDAAADRFRALGFDVLDGGLHPGVGTANRVVPLGAQYLELLGVVAVNRARESEYGRSLLRAIADGDRLVRWSLRTDAIENVAARLGIEVEHRQRVRPDGELLATGGGDLGKSGEIKFWDTETWQIRGRILPHQQVVTHCAFSYDGRKLSTADQVPSVHLWNLSNETEELSLARVGQPPWMCLAPDAKTLVVSGYVRENEPIIGHHFGFLDTASGQMRGAHGCCRETGNASSEQA